MQPAQRDLTASTLAVAFLCVVPAGGFVTLLLCALELGWF